MYDTILLIIGIMFVIISTINIKKISNEEEMKYEEIIEIYDQIMEYKDYFNELFNDFESLIDSSLNKVNNTKNKKELSSEKIKNSSSKIFELNKQNEDDNLIKQIFELEKIGLTSKEIAQKLDRGIREIDIILKVNKNVNELIKKH